MNREHAIKALQEKTSKAERFNSLLPLLGGMKAPNTFRYYNRAGYSEANLKTLEYDVKQAYSIKDSDLMAAPAPKQEEKKKKDQDINPENPEEKKLKVFEQAPDEVKEYVKLRERYPFLNDPDCPEKLHTLVGLNATAYKQVLEARRELFKNFPKGEEEETTPMTEQEVFELAQKAVENFTVNIEGEQELDYYKEHGEILGNHEIFADEKLQEKVDKLSTADLANHQRNLKNYIGRDFKKFEKAKEDDRKQELKDRVLSREAELRLVEKKMEVKPEDRFTSKFEGDKEPRVEISED